MEQSNQQFFWHSFDINHILHTGWDKEIHELSKYAIHKELTPGSTTSREGVFTGKISALTVDGVKIKKKIPWLYEMYHNTFLELAQKCCHEKVFTAKSERSAININIQKEKMRYEAHVDSNPLGGLLYVTSHPCKTGGELRVSNRKESSGIQEIDQNCTKIYPVKGNLVFFDAREYPHYVTQLKDDSTIRLVIAMNFYTKSCPESSRPHDLNDHLGI